MSIAPNISKYGRFKNGTGYIPLTVYEQNELDGAVREWFLWENKYAKK